MNFLYELHNKAGKCIVTQSVTGKHIAPVLEHIARIVNEQKNPVTVHILKARLDENTVLVDPQRMESLSALVTLAVEHYNAKSGNLMVENSYPKKNKIIEDLKAVLSNPKKAKKLMEAAEKLSSEQMKKIANAHGYQKTDEIDAEAPEESQYKHPTGSKLEISSGGWWAARDHKKRGQTAKSLSTHLEKIHGKLSEAKKLMEAAEKHQVGATARKHGYVRSRKSNSKTTIYAQPTTGHVLTYWNGHNKWEHYNPDLSVSKSGEGHKELVSHLAGVHHGDPPVWASKKDVHEAEDTIGVKRHAKKEHKKEHQGQAYMGMASVDRDFKKREAAQLRWEKKNIPKKLPEAEDSFLPDLNVGDTLLVGKFKNRKAEIKGFDKDDKNQPLAKTNKGDQQIFKGRIAKLMPGAEESKEEPVKESENPRFDWSYVQPAVVPSTKKELHVWSRPHREGYTAYQLTHSKDVKPMGTGHFNGKDGLERKTGIKLNEDIYSDVRKHKEAHPEKYCKNPKCLYPLEPGTFDPYCTKHGVPKNSSKAQKS